MPALRCAATIALIGQPTQPDTKDAPMSDAADFISREEVEAMVLAKAVEDPAFATRLKADPKAALSEMFETQLPANLNIHVFQETPTDLMIRLPIAGSDEISETELEGVAGGACSPLYIKGILGLIQVGAVIAGSTPRGRRW
jgi:hypothetical protein